MITDLISKMEADKGQYIEVIRELETYLFPILTDSIMNLKIDLLQSNQSLGSDLIASLSSKLVKSIFPFNQSFFKLKYTGDIEDKEPIDNLLILLEQSIKKDLTKGKIREILDDLINHLLISGNVLLDFTNDIKYYALDEYGVRFRDNEWYQIGISRKITILDNDSTPYRRLVDSGGEYDYYVKIERDNDNLATITEYIGDEEVKETKRTNIKNIPLYPIRLYPTKSNYSLGYAFKYLGDLRLYDALARISTDSAEIGSRVINLVSPMSNLANNLAELQDAQNGDFIVGGEGEVVPFQQPHLYNLQWLLQYMDTIEKRLSIAFLRGTGIVRDKAGITATEINLLIGEMTEKIGGVYATLSQSLQEPVFRAVLKKLKIDKEIGKDIEVEFLGGVNEIRDRDNLSKLAQLIPLEVLYQTPDIIQSISLEKVLKLYSKYLGVNSEDFLKDEEEIKAEQELAMQQQIIQQGTMNGKQNISKNQNQNQNQN